MSTVLVTGVSGFLGSHVALVAQAAGYQVRGTVRNAAQYRQMLEAIAPGISLVELDLMSSTKEDFAAAAEGCTFCIHVASPVELEGGDDLVTTAVEGTRKVRDGCRAAGVRRLVMTSSCDAIWKGHTKTAFSAQDWSILEKCDPYEKSKVLAEQVACGEDDLEAIAVCPSFIQGPLLLGRACISTQLVAPMLSGGVPLVPALGLNICDVRDVAEVHVRALASKEARGRFIVDSGTLMLLDFAPVLQAAFPGHDVGTRAAPWLVMWLISFFNKGAARGLTRWKMNMTFATSDTEALLGRKLRDPTESCLAMARSAVELGLVHKSETKRKGGTAWAAALAVLVAIVAYIVTKGFVALPQSPP